MKKVALLFFCLPALVLAQEFQIEKVRSLVYQKNWAGLEQKLKSGEISFPEGEQAEADFLLGYSLLKQGKTQEAIEPLKKSSETAFPLNNYAHYYLGKVYLSLGQGASAEEQYLQVIPLSAIYLPTKLSLIELYLQAKKIEAAASEIYQLRQTKIPERFYPDFLFLEAEFSRVQNQLETAQQKLKELYINFPASTPARKLEPAPELSPNEELLRAKNLINAGMCQVAKEELKELKVKLKKSEEKFLSQLLGLLARASFACRDYRAVLNLEQEAKKNARDNDEFWFYLAWSYHRLGKEEEARELYHRFLSKFKESSYCPRALYNLARMAEAKGELSLAQKYFEQLIKDYPMYELSEEARFQNGLIYFRQDRFAQAAKAFKEALPVVKNQDQFIYWLARAYEKNEEPEKAEQFRKQLLDNFPISAYAFLIDPKPKPFASTVITRPNFSLELPQEFEPGLALVRLGFLDLGQEELHWQLAQKAYPFQTLVGLANKLLELNAYALVTKLYYHYIAPNLTPEQKNFYLAYLYPKAFPELVEPRAKKYNIPLDLAYALIRAESNFHPGALSSAGAIGLTQVMPFLADDTMRKMGLAKVERFEYYDPELNLEIGFYHLNELQTKYQFVGPEPWPLFLSLCAYNAGIQAVNKWLETATKDALPPDLWMEMIPYPETKNYLKRILAGIYVYRQLYPDQAPAVD